MRILGSIVRILGLIWLTLGALRLALALLSGSPTEAVGPLFAVALGFGAMRLGAVMKKPRSASPSEAS